MKNNYRIEDGIVYIEIISKGVTHEMLIDEDDLERVSKLNSLTLKGPYAVYYYKGKNRSFHRFIIDAPKDKDVDHINACKLDNRKANLRAVTTKENMNNLNNKYPVGKSGVKGVHHYPYHPQKPWVVTVKRKSYGYYATLEEATEVANKVYEELRKEFEKEVG